MGKVIIVFILSLCANMALANEADSKTMVSAELEDNGTYSGRVAPGTCYSVRDCVGSSYHVDSKVKCSLSDQSFRSDWTGLCENF